MSADDSAVDLDERSFNLDSVDIVDDDVVDVHNELICEDRVGVDVKVEVNVDGNNLPPPPIDEEKKKEFDRQRDEILSCVPEEVKSRFGEIYFSTFGKFVGPVLVLNPYKVEPGPLRNQWLSMFRNCQKTARETDMTHLTYWYGEFNDLRSAYSFQKTSQLLSYEKGMKATEKKLKTIKRKSEAGKKLTAKELKFKKGFEEMEADRTMNPTERYGYVKSTFFEEYHILYGGDQQTVKKEDPPKSEKRKTKTSSSLKNGKTKKNKIKKEKDLAPTENQTTTDSGKSEIVEKAQETTKTKSNKRIKKEDKSSETSRPKKKAKNSAGNDQAMKTPRKSTTINIKRENESHPEEDIASSAKGDHDRIIKAEWADDRRPSAYEEFAALDEVSSRGDTDDGSLKMDDLESDTDSADEDYVEEPISRVTKKKPQKKKAKSLPKKSKEPPKKKVQKTKIKLERSTIKEEKDGAKVQKTKVKLESSTIKEEKDSANSLDLKKLLKKEQRKFRKCEIDFLPLLRRWELAISEKNVAQLSKIYEELLTSMEHFTAPFIEEYSMNHLMKRSKGYNNELRKQVLSKFKAIYSAKMNEVPKGFKAVKESEKSVRNDIKTETPTEEIEHSTVTKVGRDNQSSKEGVSITDASRTPQGRSTPTIPLPLSKPRNGDANGETATPKMLELSAQKYKKPEIKLESSSQKQNPSVGKPEKKRFSLGKLMRAGSSSSLPTNSGTKQPSLPDGSSILPSRSSKNNKNNPLWTIQVASSNEKLSNENRSFGLEFLQQAAMHIPENKTLNYEAVARNIEIAVYNWSRGKSNGQHTMQEEEQWNKYWNKIHDLAASISGKRQNGTLAKMIGDGKFASPDELVGLHDEDLWCSFQGSELSKFGN